MSCSIVWPISTASGLSLAGITGKHSAVARHNDILNFILLMYEVQFPLELHLTLSLSFCFAVLFNLEEFAFYLSDQFLILFYSCFPESNFTLKVNRF